ncbi:PTS system ascorbate-specific transporter subunits IICB [Raoultella terrigena]|uniref:PTS system ascorbate-specific transporter subunits IICB n=1 Tax=Raoultella terrigena TaxID=577 RepID=A0A485C3M5_RAOTE|nr:PTS system ascorbate-specific transporter subunits IICB [Raoultella terrigena]
MKIMAICGSGLGSSFMVEMNIKKVLKSSKLKRKLNTPTSLIGNAGSGRFIRDG